MHTPVWAQHHRLVLQNFSLGDHQNHLEHLLQQILKLYLPSQTWAWESVFPTSQGRCFHSCLGEHTVRTAGQSTAPHPRHKLALTLTLFSAGSPLLGQWRCLLHLLSPRSWTDQFCHLPCGVSPGLPSCGLYRFLRSCCLPSRGPGMHTYQLLRFFSATLIPIQTPIQPAQKTRPSLTSQWTPWSCRHSAIFLMGGSIPA